MLNEIQGITRLVLVTKITVISKTCNKLQWSIHFQDTKEWSFDIISSDDQYGTIRFRETCNEAHSPCVEPWADCLYNQ